MDPLKAPLGTRARPRPRPKCNWALQSIQENPWEHTHDRRKHPRRTETQASHLPDPNQPIHPGTKRSYTWGHHPARGNGGPPASPKAPYLNRPTPHTARSTGAVRHPMKITREPPTRPLGRHARPNTPFAWIRLDFPIGFFISCPTRPNQLSVRFAARLPCVLQPRAPRVTSTLPGRPPAQRSLYYDSPPLPRNPHQATPPRLHRPYSRYPLPPTIHSA